MTTEAKQRIINAMILLNKYKISDIAKAAHVSNRDVKFVKLPPLPKITKNGNIGNIKKKKREKTWTFTFNRTEMVFYKEMFDSEQSKWKNRSPMRCILIQIQRDKLGVDNLGT